ncbi:MAG: hypothetical protein ACRC33_19260 [Gemmataceae bacterium]
MIAARIRDVVRVGAAAALGTGLAVRFGPTVAGLICAVAAAIACAAGAVLLRTSPVGRVTWRNRAAGNLIPWGWRLNAGRLWPVVVVSWCVWVLIGTAAILLRPGPAEESPGVDLRGSLFAAWVVDGATLLYLVGTVRQATPGSRVGPLWAVSASVLAVIAVSVGLYLGDRPEGALLVAGGPPAVVGGLAGGAVLLVVTVGRNARWN